MSLVLFIAGISFIVSGIAKIAADSLLTHRIPVLGSFAGLEPTLNPGIAFGIRFGAMQDFVVLAAIIVVMAIAWRTARTTLQKAAFGLIIGGALENIVDRFMDGYVTDFFQVGSFPIFNVADSCITAGVILLLISSLREKA